MSINQSELEHLLHRFETGELTAEEFNVEKIRAERVHLVLTRIPRDIRRQLNKAVSDGRLKHKRKDGYKPEVYYHPSFEYLVASKRNAYEVNLKSATKAVVV